MSNSVISITLVTLFFKISANMKKIKMTYHRRMITIGFIEMYDVK